MNDADPAPHQRLRASPSFSFALMPDGRPYVARETEPYVQYWLDDRERRLLAAFSSRRGATVAEALAQCLPASARAEPERRRLHAAIRGMQQAGVLDHPEADTSRYDRRIVQAYLDHRPFPPEITAHIVQRGGVAAGTRVLDLAGGPGDLALQLARHMAQVTLMDWSRGFLASARQRARAQGLALQTLHESCNRLVHDGGAYDVVTVSQALHWLDDVAVCRGVLRVLQPGGHFFVVHSAFDVPDTHPLAFVLGHRSVLGHKLRTGFAKEVQALHDRVALLLRALDTADVQRVDPTLRERPAAPLRSAGVQLYRQQRPLGLGFLQGLLTQRHLEGAGLDPQTFWDEVRSRCAAATPQQLMGTHDWALLHFSRTHRPGRTPTKAKGAVQAIACTAP